MFPPILPTTPPGSSLKIDGVARIENALTFLAPSGGGLVLKVGDVIKADVLSLMADGSVSIRITGQAGESAVVSARSHVPLDQGESVLLKVMGGEKEITLRFLGVAGDEGDGGQGRPGGVSMALRGMESALAVTRMPAGDVRQMQQIFRAFPASVKASIPGFALLEGGTGMEGLDGKALRQAVEGSGVLFETKLKLVPESAAAGMDRKGALLRVGEAMRELGGSSEVRGAGISPGETAVKAEGMVSSIETYQVSSTAHNVLYAPLTLDWEEMRDGEILFRKRDRGRGESYTCEMNLDLDPLGKMSVSVTMYDGAFFVSLSPEDEGTRSLMAENSGEIGKRFREAGLPLRAMAVQRKASVSFGVLSADGVDLEV